MLKRFVGLPNDIKGSTVANVMLNDKRPFKEILLQMVASCKGYLVTAVGRNNTSGAGVSSLVKGGSTNDIV